MRTALMRSLTDWVTKNAPMPASRYPRLADGTLVAATREAMGFPVIPGRPSPDGVQYPALDYDLGRAFRYHEQSGSLSALPEARRSLPQLVPKVDADGNEIAGVLLPDIAVPLATHTGWNLYKAPYPEGELCDRDGTYVPFAATRAEREARGDPRPSLEERYGNHAAYVRRLEEAAAKLVAARLLLREDAEQLVARARNEEIAKRFPRAGDAVVGGVR